MLPLCRTLFQDTRTPTFVAALADEGIREDTGSPSLRLQASVIPTCLKSLPLPGKGSVQRGCARNTEAMMMGSIKDALERLDCLVPRPVGQRQWSGQTKGELPLSAFVGIAFMGTFEQRSHNSHIKKAPRVIAGAYLLLMSTRFARNHDSVGVMVCAVAGRTATAKPCQHPWMPGRFDQDLDHPI